MTIRPFLGGSLIAVILSFYAQEAGAADSDGEPGKPTTKSALDDRPPWALRLSVAGGAPIPALHEQILSEEGYSGPRFALTLAVERRVSGHFGLGVLGRYQFRSLSPALPEGALDRGFNGPTYSEHSWLLAVDAPITFVLSQRAKGRATELCIVPWVGAGAGKAELHDHSAWRPGPAFGGEVRLLWHGGPVAGGFTAGAYSFRIAQPSSIEGPLELGMILVSAMGGFDVG
jgi:hypothetical protein